MGTKTITLTAGQIDAVLTAVKHVKKENEKMLSTTNLQSFKTFLKEQIELLESSHQEMVKS